MKFIFELTERDGRVVRIERFQYILKTSRGGFSWIGGTEYSISPVLADRIISPGLYSVFVRLLRSKITFEKLPYTVLMNGRRENLQVIWAPVYHKTEKQKKVKPTTKAKSCMAHYLFCKYGFTGAMQKYAGVTPVIGTIDNITPESFPPDEWTIYCSTDRRPDSVIDKMLWQPSSIAVAIPRAANSSIVRGLLAGLFYVIDNFPSRFLPDYLESKRLWCVIMGHILWSGSILETKLHDDTCVHLASLDAYIDTMIEKGLKEIGYDCKTIYDLFAVLIADFSRMIIDAREQVTSMYDKELSVLYYVYEPVNNAIFNLVFAMRSGEREHFTEREVLSIMAANFKKGTIYAITKQKPFLTPVSSSGDNLVFRITTSVVAQQKAASVRAGRLPPGDPSRQMDASIPDVGQGAALPKAEPTGRERLNPYIHLEGWVTKPHPETKELLQELQPLFRRK